MARRKTTVKRYRVRWKVLVVRLSLMALVAWLTTVGLLQALPGLRWHGSSTVHLATSTVVVQPGDSLWSIATMATGPGKDSRPVVESIRRLNHLTSSVIQPGANLRVPLIVKGERVASLRRGQTESRRKS